MYKYLEKESELEFNKIFNQVIGINPNKGKFWCKTVFLFFLGYNLFKDFCENDSDEPIQQFKFYEQVVNDVVNGIKYLRHIFYFI